MYYVTNGDDKALMELLERHDPIVVGLYANLAVFPLYKSGIYAINADVCPPKVEISI